MFSIEELKINATITPLDDLSDTHQINTPVGVIGIRAGEVAAWINNDLVKPNSVIFANLETVDQLATSAHATEQTDGSFVIRLNTNCEADVRVGFLVVTPV